MVCGQFERLDKGTIKCKRRRTAAERWSGVQNKLPGHINPAPSASSDTETGLHKVDLKIQVFRELPTHCETPPILIDHPFMPNSYGRSDLSSDFSEKVLPAQYETTMVGEPRHLSASEDGSDVVPHTLPARCIGPLCAASIFAAFASGPRAHAASIVLGDIEYTRDGRVDDEGRAAIESYLEFFLWRLQDGKHGRPQPIRAYLRQCSARDSAESARSIVLLA